jgi:succinate-semialdehyde dehydrogenase/glutarate-semialdehyde dehydrogenase
MTQTHLSTYHTYNPATGDCLTTLPNMGKDETELAIQTAHQAFLLWRKTLAKERARLLYRWYELILENQDQIAKIMVQEQGKPMKEAKGEILYGASFVKWFAEEARRPYGDIIPTDQPSKRIWVHQEPVGVVAAITPWNFPMAMITRKCAPAFAAGCSVILKPAEQTPLTALLLKDLALQAGFPNGLFQVLTADRTQSEIIGQTLMASFEVRKLTFTGSTKVGKHLMALAAQNVKKISLELGGNAPFLIFESADLKQATQGAMMCKFRNAGQTCISANRFLVHQQVLDLWLPLIKDATEKLKVGNGFETGVDIGPLINQTAIEKVDRLVQDAISKGAQLVLGGHRLEGLFYAPTILIGIHSNMQIYHEEIFGPVIAIQSFTSEDEAIQLANDTKAGLAAYFYSQSYQQIFRVSSAIQAGMVAVNDGALSTEIAPFGGTKESGIGREGGRYGMGEFLEEKYVAWGGL